MGPIRRRTLIATLGATALTGCVPAGIAMRGDAGPLEGGIGGTGIVGTLADFGSLIVNGLRVELPDHARISNGYGSISASALAVGQTLAVEATMQRGTPVADWVRISHPLVGLVERGTTARGAFTVNGITVVPEPGMIGQPHPGTRAAISGVWSGARVIASRIDQVGSGASDLIAGDALSAEDGRLQVGGMVTDRAAGAPRLRYVTAVGRYADGIFHVETLQEGRFSRGLPWLANLLVEGFLTPTDQSPGRRISGLGHSFDAQAQVVGFDGVRGLFVGAYNGHFRVERAAALPQDLRLRRALVAQAVSAPGVLDFRSTRP